MFNEYRPKDADSNPVLEVVTAIVIFATVIFLWVVTP